MVHSTLDETSASLRMRTSKMAENAPCTIPLRAFFGRFLGSRSPRCGGLLKRAIHHFSSREAGRKMLHRTPSETSYTSSTRYPKIGRKHQVSQDLRSQPDRLRPEILRSWIRANRARPSDAGQPRAHLGTIFRVTSRLERWCIALLMRPPHR